MLVAAGRCYEYVMSGRRIQQLRAASVTVLSVLLARLKIKPVNRGILYSGTSSNLIARGKSQAPSAQLTLSPFDSSTTEDGVSSIPKINSCRSDRLGKDQVSSARCTGVSFDKREIHVPASCRTLSRRRGLLSNIVQALYALLQDTRDSLLIT